MRSELPTGTVTFVFTDIEGSTRLLQEHPAEYPEILETQRSLIRSILSDHAGIEVDVSGDALFFVFTSAQSAAKGAARVQESLAAARWPGGVTVRVRMGLHTGEGRRGPEGYVGLDVHRAARICSAAHGGQVLLSESTRSLVERDPASGLDILDLGRHQLKDLERVERLAQLVIPGLPGDFPTPRSVGPRRGLPVRLSRFIGREIEVEQLRALLVSDRLLTLTGPGGTGKTRLALAVAEAEQDRFQDGAIFVDLAPLVDSELVPSAAASALGARATGGRTPTEAVVEYLSEKQLLLVLDNFEQVLPAATFVREVLTGCPDVSIVVTSRAPLRLEGEQEWSVAPLGLPDPSASVSVSGDALDASDAVRLFVDRARSVNASFDVAEENAEAVVDICRRLDGIPLAIELAASHCRVQAPSLLRERLASALDLTGGGGERPERHRTLRDTIAWSIDLLPASDQDLFRRLAVFRGGWTLAAAESVVGGQEVAVLDGLERLVSYSLVRMTDSADPRMTMLDTIRTFAADELRTRADPAGSADRHAVFFLAFAEEAAQHLLGPDRDEWLERLDRDHDNIRAAIEWFTEAGEIEHALRLATAVMPFWHLRAHLGEGRAVFDSLLATDLASVDPSVLAPATAAAGEIAVYQADYPAATKLTSWSLSLYRSIEDPRGAARQLNNLGWSTMMRDTPEAIGLFEEAHRVASPTSALEIVGNALTGRATALFRLGRVEEARAAAGKAIQAFVSSGERFIHVFALLILGAAALSEGRPDVALEQYVEALGMALATGEWTVIGGSLDSVADLLLDHGDAALGIMIASVTARRRVEIGGASSIDMAGKEMPLVRAARTSEPDVFERSCREAEALTVDDVVRAVHALERRVSSGEQVLPPVGETSPPR